ncbi:hypothetical protein A5792_19940 [Mycolicibacterium peregrinum]|uniref:Uncharacterized protein n=2 Tax=Mycolicibacterium TaxID=1866885 RepID=A0A1A0R3T1_MYCPR|nr:MULTISPECIES: hypothetical protein [Mycolicibacterium]MCV6998654.1 hypothetical protein [Mycolicibacterium alvei]OBB29086.1 hypothetical protein A5792_19940 [Mycolicibacterium peregrinum]BBX25415.1 hypothetical protein MALV_05400 [Mycolicibacterium alvei]
MLYSDTTTDIVWIDHELVAALREEIAELDDEQLLKREYDLHGDAAIREYIIEASLVGIYTSVGPEVAFRRISDGEVFSPDEIEAEFAQDVCDLEPAHRAEITFARWMDEVGYVEVHTEDEIAEGQE